MTGEDLRELMVLTLRQPTAAVARLRALNLPMSARWMGLVLAVCLSAGLSWISLVLFPADPTVETTGTAMSRMAAQPLVMAAVQAGVLVMTAVLMTVVGRAFGGTGDFPDALLLIVWIELVLFVVQLAQLVLALVFPPLAAILFLIAMILLVGLSILFTKALHGFESTARVALGVFATLLAAGMVLTLLAAALGLTPPMPA